MNIYSVCTMAATFHPVNFGPYLIGCLHIYVWNIKYRLFTKLNAQIKTNLRDEFFKTN